MLDLISDTFYSFKRGMNKFTTGFFYGKPSEEAQIYDSNTYISEYVYLGMVQDFTEEGRCIITQKNIALFIIT